MANKYLNNFFSYEIATLIDPRLMTSPITERTSVRRNFRRLEKCECESICCRDQVHKYCKRLTSSIYYSTHFKNRSKLNNFQSMFLKIFYSHSNFAKNLIFPKESCKSYSQADTLWYVLKNQTPKALKFMLVRGYDRWYAEYLFLNSFTKFAQA